MEHFCYSYTHSLEFFLELIFSFEKYFIGSVCFIFFCIIKKILWKRTNLNNWKWMISVRIKIDSNSEFSTFDTLLDENIIICNKTTSLCKFCFIFYLIRCDRTPSSIWLYNIWKRIQIYERMWYFGRFALWNKICFWDFHSHLCNKEIRLILVQAKRMHCKRGVRIPVSKRIEKCSHLTIFTIYPVKHRNNKIKILMRFKMLLEIFCWKMTCESRGLMPL